MRSVVLILLAIIASAFSRTLLPVNEVTEQLLRDNGFEPDGSWMQVTYEGDTGPEPPDEFDARHKWRDCVRHRHDEGKCLGSWAIAAASVLSDQICIKSGGKTNVDLSAQYLLSCDRAEGGCNGKYVPKNVFQYLADTGIPTEQCVPWDSWKDGKNGTCPEGRCIGSETFTSYKCGKVIFAVSELDIKREIMTIGPMFCKFDRYKDFDDYKSGIYYKVSNELLEKDHAVKVLGWGVENTIHFWLVTNTWQYTWGENGHFRIKMGESSMCTIALGCDPTVA